MTQKILDQISNFLEILFKEKQNITDVEMLS